MHIEPVIWDSVFFHLTIGKINEGVFNRQEFLQEKEVFDLIYIFEKPESNNNAAISSINAVLVDEKITYKIILKNVGEMDAAISVYTQDEPTDKLISLTLQSGIYSRFKTDKNFPAEAYEKLYITWIKKSCDKSIAFRILIYGEMKNPSGFITLTGNGSEAQIGLIAVDEQHRGQGIGRKLIEAAINTAKNHNFTTLKVVTQGANQQACLLYEKCGFVIDSKINIYHYWNKKDAYPI